MKEITSQIIPTNWYSVNQIAKKKWIFGMGFEGVKHLVLTGRLPAAYFRATRDAQVRYRIYGKHIIQYIKDNQPKAK